MAYAQLSDALTSNMTGRLVSPSVSVRAKTTAEKGTLEPNPFPKAGSVLARSMARPREVVSSAFSEDCFKLVSREYLLSHRVIRPGA
jgi:hypothetical protein